MGQESRRPACRSRYFVKTTAARINCHSSAITTAAVGTITNPAARWRRPWWAGGCRAIERHVSQNATANRFCLTFGTRCEQIAPESAVRRRTRLFTARYRRRLQAAHHIQHEQDSAQPSPTTRVNSSGDDMAHFHGVTGGTLSVAGGMSTVLPRPTRPSWAMTSSDCHSRTPAFSRWAWTH